MRTMNVRELIEELATKEPTAQVYIGEAFGRYVPVHRVAYVRLLNGIEVLGIETYDELPRERGR